MKKDEYAKQSFNHPASSLEVSRREFLKRIGLLGGGIVVYVSLGDPSSWAQQPSDFNAFLKIRLHIFLFLLSYDILRFVD